MGKCVRIRSSSSKQASPSPGEAAAYLTLRSGRRVPVAACSSPGRRHHRRGGAGSAACRCGAKDAAKRACSRSPRRTTAEPRPPRDLVLGSQQLSGGRPEEEELPSQASPVARDAAGFVARDTFEANTPLAVDVVKKVKHEHDSKAGVAGQQSPSPPLEAEMEAFFAAAELAERRRFAEAYNYDIALDRPLEGRFEWAPVST